MTAVLLLLVLGADPPSKNVRAYLDSQDAFRERQLLAVKELIVSVENVLAEWEQNPPAKQTVKGAKRQLADLRKLLSKLEDPKQKIEPDLRTLSLGAVGKLPTEFTAFIPPDQFKFSTNTVGIVVYHQRSYWITANAPAGQLAQVRMKEDQSSSGRFYPAQPPHRNDGPTFSVMLPGEKVKGQRVDKLLAGKVWRVTKGNVLEPFDMAEVEAYLETLKE